MPSNFLRPHKIGTELSHDPTTWKRDFLLNPDAEMPDATVEAVEAGANNTLLNLVRVTKLDSSHIGEFDAAHISIKKRGGRLLLAGLWDRLTAPSRSAISCEF